MHLIAISPAPSPPRRLPSPRRRLWRSIVSSRPLPGNADISRWRYDAKRRVTATMSPDHVGAVFRQLTVAGFAPLTRLVVERNKSNVEFYDYKRTRTEFGISRAF